MANTHRHRLNTVALPEGEGMFRGCLNSQINAASFLMLSQTKKKFYKSSAFICGCFAALH